MYWHVLALVWFGILATYSPFSHAEQNKQKPSFSEYVAELKQGALDTGLSSEFVESNFAKIKLFKKAVVTEQTPTPVIDTIDTYLRKSVPSHISSQGVALYKENAKELERIGKKYGVQPRFIVALWGVESRYGQTMGNYPVLSVTASLAYEGKKEAFFKKQFYAALDILESQKVEFSQLLGSWSGAMGQMQFMPVTYIAYAQDGDGDGKADIWNNLSDAFASAAYFLQQQGWKSEETWGRQVQIPSDFDQSLLGIDKSKTFSEWQALGVRRYNGSDLPSRDDMLVSLIMPDGVKGRKYLVYDNYKSLLAWNRSHHFAVSVAYLSEKIKAAK